MKSNTVKANEFDKQYGKICDLNPLSEMMGHKKHLVLGIIDEFIAQIPKDLLIINEAVRVSDFESIKRSSHSMKSSALIMGISILATTLNEMEALGQDKSDIDKITLTNIQINHYCQLALNELEEEKRINY